MRLHPLTVVVLGALLSGPAAAEETAAPKSEGTTIPVNLEIHAEIRHRLEIDAREKFDPDRSTTEFHLLRSRLAVGAKLPKNVSVFLQGQDSRTWGEETSTMDGSSPRGDMHQGYILAEDFLTPGAWLQLGRTEMVYGNERLIGAVGWSNTGRSFDGVVLGYKGASYSVDLFETKIAEGVGSASRGKDYDFFGAWATTSALAGHTIDVFALYDRDADTLATGEERLKRLTVGGRLTGAQGALAYEAEAASQSGDQGASSVSAAMFAANVSYELPHSAKPRVGIGVDWLSGDDDATDDEVKVFNTLFATNHGFYGYMDFFLDIPRDTQGLGLVDVMFKLSGQPADWLKARLHVHSFRAAEDLKVTGSGGSEETFSSFGTEVDLVGDVTCTDNVGVQAGASVFAPGDIFKRTRGEDKAYWAYLQTTVRY